MRLDDLLPSHDAAEVHSIMVDASPERVFRALKRVRPADLAGFRLLMGIRALPARALTRRRFSFDRERPLLDQFLAAGFVVLAEEPERELVVGRIAQFWKLVGGSSVPVRSAEDFVAFDAPGYAKAAANFSLDIERDGLRLSTQTRVRATDPVSRRTFARYWLLIRPGSGLIRRMWLKAIKHQAELLRRR